MNENVYLVTENSWCRMCLDLIFTDLHILEILHCFSYSSHIVMLALNCQYFFQPEEIFLNFSWENFLFSQTQNAALCSRYKYICFVLPQDVLTTPSGLLFITLGAQLVNDDSPECRKMVAHCLKTMLERLHTDVRNQLFDVVIVWLKDKKVCIVFYLVECFLKV
jgi:hypothetical protein